jgi:hypothetical protein
VELLESPEWDEQWQGEILARHDGWKYVWLWYGWNIRLMVLWDGEPCAQTWGTPYAWCYERSDGPEPVREALRAWDPDTQDEPLGYKKRAAGARVAPSRDPRDPYNRPRCEHGAYMDVDLDCRLTVCHTTLGYRRKHGMPLPPFRVGL